MTTTTLKRTMFDALIGEPLSLALSQPHQILLSSGSVALMGSFASSSKIIDPTVGYLIAVGVEWAYLRGLASDSRAQTGWGSILNWSAFGIVVLWGVLWCAQQFGVFDEARGGWPLAAAHVVPIAWLSLCSAQCHRAALGAERRKSERRTANDEAAERKHTADRAALALEDEAERLKIERWKIAQLAKREVAASATTATPQPPQPAQPRNPVIVDGIEYPSVQAAANAHGISRQAMSKRLKRNQESNHAD